jgi:hypothetical protein
LFVYVWRPASYRLAATQCRLSHRKKLKGSTFTNDLALKKIPPDLHGVFARKTLPSGVPATDEAVRQNVLTGKGMMPGFVGRFTDEQLAALLAYLHTGLR